YKAPALELLIAGPTAASAMSEYSNNIVVPTCEFARDIGSYFLPMICNRDVEMWRRQLRLLN
ncbi:MAG: hypothetical protein WB787_15725, partial [Candidatus Acidiferrales bacterium]